MCILHGPLGKSHLKSIFCYYWEHWMFSPLMRHTRQQLIDTEYVSMDFPDLKMKNKICTRPFDSYYLKRVCFIQFTLFLLNSCFR